jgi:putative hydrolase of the HAD superfamily
MKVYRHLFFDLDHTLWDFEANSKITLAELFHDYALEGKGVSLDCFITVFRRVNADLWKKYNTRQIDKFTLRKARFNMVFSYFNYENEKLASVLDVEYIERCPVKDTLIPSTVDVLEYCKEKGYKVHILTNGFLETQTRKLQSCAIHPYVDEMITSECSGYQKPDVDYFTYSMNKVRCSQQECIMVGDNLNTDILGARNAGIDQVYFNPHQKKHSETVTHEIQSLLELKTIV